MNKNDKKYVNRIVNAFVKNKIISPLPVNIQKNYPKLKNLESYVKVKLKSLLLDLKQLNWNSPIKKIKRKEPFMQQFKNNVLKIIKV